MTDSRYEPTLKFRRSGEAGTGHCADLYFDSASIGLESLCARDAATQSTPEWEKALDAVKERCGVLFGTQFGKDQVMLFHNTTAGVQRVLSRLQHIIGHETLTLLTTDIEYPGIIAAVDENWQGRAVIAQVSQLVWDGKPQCVEPALRKAFMLTEPDVVYLSHIARATGFEVPVHNFLAFAKELNPRLVVIVDGAQAAGNIQVEPHLVNEVDFYVTSGHKWLGGRTTLGIVASSPEWRLSDPSQSYSRKSGSAGTGIAEALRSLLKALEEFVDPAGGEEPKARQERIANHNKRLAQRFVELLTEKFSTLKPVIEEPSNGIVTIPDVPDGIINTLWNKGFRFSRLRTEPWRTEEGGDAPGKRNRFFVTVGPDSDDVSIQEVRFRETGVGPPFPRAGALRLCFHLYHRDDDVQKLVEAVLGTSGGKAAAS